MVESSSNGNGAGEWRLTLGEGFRRGFTLRCVYCGQGRLFRGLLRMNSHCAECGTKFERESGYFLGSTYINYGVTAIITVISYVLLHFGMGWQNGVVMPVVLSFCLFFPLFFFRFARSLWLALDCFFDQLGANEAMAGSRPTEPPKEKPPGTPK